MTPAAGQDHVPVNESDQIISQFKAVFRRRKLLILSCAVLCLGPIAVYNEVTPPTYESYVTLIMDEFVGPSASFNPERSQDVRTSNRLQELSSYSFADEVARALTPASRERFRLPEPLPPDFNEVEFMARRVHKALSAYAVRGTNLVRVSVATGNAVLSRDIANTAVTVFEERNNRIEREGVTGIRKFVEDQLARFEAQLTESEDVLRKYKEENKITSFTDQAQQILRRMTDAEVEYNTVKANLQSLERRLASVEENLALQRRDLVPTVTEIGNPWVQRLKERLVELQLQYTELKVQNYDPSHPKMVQLESDIEGTKKQLVAEATKIAGGESVVDPIAQIEKYISDSYALQIEIESLRAQERALALVIEDYNQSLQTLPEKELNLARLTRERDVNQKIYNGLLEKLEESKMSQAEQIPTVRIIDAAYINPKPTRPRKRFNLAVGMLFGLVAGTSLGFLRERAAVSIGSARELEKFLGWPVMGSIPRILKLPAGKLKIAKNGSADGAMTARETRHIKRSLISVLEPHGGPAEAFRILRTNLQLQGLGDQLRTLLITSVAPDEGKSTIVTNLAASLAGVGDKVLLMDAELRRPGMHTVFGVEDKPGLRDLLATKIEAWEAGPARWSREAVMSGQTVATATGSPNDGATATAAPGASGSVYRAMFESAFQLTRVEGLSVLAAGSDTGNENDIISMCFDRMRALMADLKKEYRFIVIDCPPISLVHDAAVLARLADTVLFVVNSSRADKEMLLNSRDMLESSGAHVIGSVLNHVEPVGIYKTNKYYHGKT